MHSAQDASIYRLTNVGLHFINCVVDPQNFGPNWSLCCEIECSVATEFPVFISGLYRSMQSFVATYSLNSFLNSVATDFDNVVIEFWCSSLVLVTIEMHCVATPNLFATSFSCPSIYGVCRDIIFLVVTNIFFFNLSTLSRPDFFESLAISVVIGSSLVTTDFYFPIFVAC